MKKTILIPLLVISSNIIAQETVSSAGEELNNNSAKISITIGESIIQEFVTETHTILNGYHQPKLKIETINIKETENWMVTIFPNPSQNTIHIDWNHFSITELNYQPFSIEGKLIKEGASSKLFSIDISEISAGNYMLILNNEKETQTYKIQKIN